MQTKRMDLLETFCRVYSVETLHQPLGAECSRRERVEVAVHPRKRNAENLCVHIHTKHRGFPHCVSRNTPTPAFYRQNLHRILMISQGLTSVETLHHPLGAAWSRRERVEVAVHPRQLRHKPVPLQKLAPHAAGDAGRHANPCFKLF